MGAHAVAATDVTAAAERIRDDVVRTRSAISQTLSAITGAHVVVKFENEQFTGSFKDRGAANHLRAHASVLARTGVVAMSAGNHAQGVAHHATRLGIPATVVMPTSAPFSKVSQTRALGATVLQEGETLVATTAAARRLVVETGASWVHPYDDPHVIAGQGTVAVELLEDHPDLEVVVVPTGGGGLLAGMAAYLAERAPHLEIVGVQSEVYPGMVAALAGHPLEPGARATIADGIAVKQPGALTVPIVRDLVSDVITVREETIERAIALFAEIEKTVAEGAGAASLATLLEHGARFRGRRVGLVLSGGNIDTRVLASVLMRELVQTGRITLLRITLADLPGQLAPVLQTIADHGANVVEVDHRRLFDPVSVRSANVDVVVETRSSDHAEAVADALIAEGHDVAVLTP